MKKDFYRPPSLQHVASHGRWRESAELSDGRFPWAIPSFLHRRRKVEWAEMLSRRWNIRLALIRKMKKKNLAFLPQAFGHLLHLECA